MAVETGVSVNFLPLLGIIDGVVVIHGVRWRETKALIHARNLITTTQSVISPVYHIV